MRLAVPVLLLLLLAACETDEAQDYLNPAGPYARKADSLWNLVFLVAVVIFFLVEGALVFALWKFRHKPGRQAAQFHGNMKLEILLTAVPALILAGIAVPTINTIFDIAEEPKGGLQVTVIAHRFWWEYDYPDLGVKTANELVIPTGVPVHVTLAGAAVDPVDQEPEVIHSWWIPRLAGKQDIVPGRNTTLNLQADEPGAYKGQCTEFCGLSHANMRIRAVAMSPDEFDQWIEDQKAPAVEPQDSLAQEGQRLFAEGSEGDGFPNGPACAACHSLDANLEDGVSSIGPNLAHFASRETFGGATFERTDEELTRWLENPPEMKPGVKMPALGLTPEEIQALVAYLQSLE